MIAMKPLPDLDDTLTLPFWEATRQGRLMMPECATCGYLQWPPERICPECQHPGLRWREVPATGTLWSYAVYHRALDPAFADDVPYAVGLVEVDDVDRKMYGILIADESDLQIGARVRAIFTPASDEVTFVRWQLDA